MDLARPENTLGHLDGFEHVPEHKLSAALRESRRRGAGGGFPKRRGTFNAVARRWSPMAAIV